MRSYEPPGFALHVAGGDPAVICSGSNAWWSPLAAALRSRQRHEPVTVV
jgi:hypothetical protein